MINKNAYNTVWKIQHSDPNQRIKSVGQVILANDPIMIEHCATSHHLASDKIQYRNDFGTEYEVCVHSYTSNNKSQHLALEQCGKITRDQPTKLQYEQNIWLIVTAPDPSYAEIVNPPPKYTAEDLILEVKNMLIQRGTTGIRGLGYLFRIMDQKGNRKLDIDELREGLSNHGVDLNGEQITTVFNYFDRNKSGFIDFDEFLRAIRVNITCLNQIIFSIG